MKSQNEKSLLDLLVVISSIYLTCIQMGNPAPTVVTDLQTIHLDPCPQWTNLHLPLLLASLVLKSRQQEFCVIRSAMDVGSAL
jgi:hypothetical protein